MDGDPRNGTIAAGCGIASDERARPTLFRERPAPAGAVRRAARSELEDESSFALAIQQAEDRRNAPGRGERRQFCEVVIVVSDDKKTWRDVEVFWRGPWRPALEGGIPRPTLSDLIEVGRQTGARIARSVLRSTI
jgi:hypothetical protein